MKDKTIPFREIEAKWRQDPAYVAAYKRIGPLMDFAFALADARRAAGVILADVAKRVGTSQAAVARLEGRTKPTWATIERYAQAAGRRPVVTLLAAE